MPLLRRRKKLIEPWDSRTPLLDWCEGAPWTIGDSYAGTVILGGTGSGKSSGSLATISKAMLSAGYGGLFLTSKVEDRATYTRYVHETGRDSDLLVFAPESDLRYNFIADEQRHSAGPVGLVENLSALLMTISELGDRSGGGGGGQDENKYFRLEAQRLCRNGLLTLVLTGRPVTIPDLHHFITSAPQSPEQVKSEAWQDSSFCYECLQLADAALKSESQRADFALAISYFLNEWPGLSSRTRSVVQSTLTSVTDILSRGACRDMLSSPSPNVSPSDMYEGAVMIADFPVLQYRDIGQTIQCILKFMWQRAHAKRDVNTHPRPTFIAADEAQLLLVDADQHFQAISRSTRTAVVYATQSISGMIDAFGPNSEPQIHSLLTNLQTKLCHQQTDARTVQYFQELVGRSRQTMMSGNQSHNDDWMAPLFGDSEGSSGGFSENMDFELQAADFNSLLKGGPPHFMTEALVYQGGRSFLDGRTWRRVGIHQRTEARRAR